MNRKILVYAVGLVLLIYCLWVLLLKGVNREVLSPVSPFTEEPCPTPTNTPEPKLSYLFGQASWYGQEYCGPRLCRTASGAVFDENAFTAACTDDFPLGSKLVVSYFEKSIEVVCNDRGGFTKKYGRILDLTKKAFETLAPLEKGTIWVRVRRVD